MIDITKKYRTRDGREVRLISDQGPKDFPIIGCVANNVSPESWTTEGAYYPGGDMSDYDLIEVKEKKVLKCWVNFYSTTVMSFLDKDEADRYAIALDGRIGTAVEVTLEVEV